MATPSSTASPSSLGECVLCGKKSSTRCSSCAKGGLDWMFFCSREHQKLLWSIHQRVCGGEFKWPGLKRREIEEMKVLGTTPFRTTEGMDTWLEVFKKESGLLPHVDIQGMFKICVDGLGNDTADLPGKQAATEDYRGLAFTVKRGSGKFAGETFRYSDLFELIRSDPFGYLADSEDRWLELRADSQDTAWMSTFQHRMLIFVAIIIFVHNSMQSMDGAEVKNAVISSRYAFKQVKKLAGEVIRDSHPEEAKSILEDYLPTLLQDVGLRRSIGEFKFGASWDEAVEID